MLSHDFDTPSGYVHVKESDKHRSTAAGKLVVISSAPIASLPGLVDHLAMTGKLPIDEENRGILARVPGPYCSAAWRTLPDPETAPDDRMKVEIDIPDFGLTLITFRRHRWRHHKTSRSAWIAVHAELVGGGKVDNPGG